MAISQIGRPSVPVDLTVRTAKDRLEKRAIVFLDSEADFKHPDNLGVAVSAEAAAKFKANRPGLTRRPGHSPVSNWSSDRVRYAPPGRASSSAWVPASATRPSATT